MVKSNYRYTNLNMIIKYQFFKAFFDIGESEQTNLTNVDIIAIYKIGKNNGKITRYHLTSIYQWTIRY